MNEPLTTALIVGYFEDFLIDRDAERFRQRVLGRYSESTLKRLLRSGDARARRSSVFALGLVGSFQTNSEVATALKDEDPLVRGLAHQALWAIWFRADTPDNNATLNEVRMLIGDERLDEAINAATALIQRSPQFAEVYNQRAIAHYFLGHLEESAADCRRVLSRNPYHFGALSGLGRVYLDLGQRDEALRVFHRLLELQPYDVDVRETIEMLETSRG